MIKKDKDSTPKQSQTSLLDRLPRIPRVFRLGSDRSPIGPEDPVIPVRDIQSTIRVLGLSDIHNGTIAGIPLRDVRRQIMAAQAEEKNLEETAPERARQKRNRLGDLKSMLLTERVQRAVEVGQYCEMKRGTKEDQQQMFLIARTAQQVNSTVPELIKPSLSKKRYQGELPHELRKAHDLLPRESRAELESVIDDHPKQRERVLQQRLTRLLELRADYARAKIEVDGFRAGGKPLGAGLPGVRDSAVVKNNGIHVYCGGRSRLQKSEQEEPDAFFDWQDFRNGAVDIGVAPNSFDGIRSVWKLITGKKAEALPRTVVITEKASGRLFKISMPNADRFVHAIRSSSRVLADAQERIADEEADLFRGENAPIVRSMLNSLEET